MIHKEQLLEGDLIFVLHHFLSSEECERFIARSEEVGYEDAPISTGAGFVMRKDIRNNDRVMIDDPELATLLWERAQPFMPVHWFGWEPVGLNERFRYYRYDPGQQFAPHTDGYFQRDNGERSQFTFMVYLNDGCEGGETAFYLPQVARRATAAADRGKQYLGKKPAGESQSRGCVGGLLRVQPERGKALVFAHRQLHEGAPVVRGRKYVLRSDVMYRRVSAVTGC
jgi:hypothetical protein